MYVTDEMKAITTIEHIVGAVPQRVQNATSQLPHNKIRSAADGLTADRFALIFTMV